MRILITGGLGFIGANLAAALVDRPGLRISILDHAQPDGWPPPNRDPRIAVRVGDILDQRVVETSVAEADAVVHLAAVPGVMGSIEVPRQSFRTNVEGTLNLLEAVRTQGARRLIFASSNAAVGGHEPPFDESKVLMPTSPYGATKAAGEALCLAYAKTFGLPTVSLRFSNVYGPYSWHKASVVSTFFRLALRGSPLTVHGDGSQTRDFLFVEDLCEAIWLAVERAEPGSVFHIASGVETPIGTLARKIKQLVESDLEIEVPVTYVSARADGVSRNYASIALACERLGYSPRVSLDEGLRRTWQWFKGCQPALHSIQGGGIGHGAE